MTTVATPPTELLPSGTPTQLYVGGRWVDAADGATTAVEDPATGAVLAHVADATPADALAALDAAEAAGRRGSGWAGTSARKRSRILRRAHDLVVARTEELALVMTLEMGKPLAEARGEVAYAAGFLEWFSEEAVRIGGEYGATPGGTARTLVSRRPVGTCLLITPWNFPLAMAARKIAPALAAGCTMVLKPAPQTPLSSLLLASILEEAGLPAGVVNVVPTTRSGEVVEPLLTSGRVRKLSFTGSTGVGRLLLAQAAECVVRTSMELGGNAPFIVFEDADLDLAVAGAQQAKMRNMGEACVAANRFYVHRSVAEEFARRLGERMGSMVVGAGTEPQTQVGPLIDERSRTKVAGLVDDAVARGARVVTGARVPDGPGWFYPPTVLDGVHPASELVREEIFGPVAAIQVFDTVDEVLDLANDTPWGLAGYVYTRDLDRALAVADDLETGMVGLNGGTVSDPAAPFGGVKQSGFGREGGRQGIEEYLDVKMVMIPIVHD